MDDFEFFGELDHYLRLLIEEIPDEVRRSDEFAESYLDLRHFIEEAEEQAAAARDKREMERIVALMTERQRERNGACHNGR
jgi:septal ring factor EnvC (AmiA/AmiB activator)